MYRKFRQTRLAPLAVFALAAFTTLGQAVAQERTGRIDVSHYKIDVTVNQNTQSLSGQAAVAFTPLDDNITSATFELNNALEVSKVVDSTGEQIPASRSQQDFSVRLNFREPLPKGQKAEVTFFYDGRLSGQEDSPVYGIKFASIQPDYAYLMYPARWFPVSGYTADRFSSEMNITVNSGNRVLGSGSEAKTEADGKVTYSFKLERESFPGSVAIVKDGPGQPVRAEGGINTTFFFRGEQEKMASEYGAEFGKIVPFLASKFGLAPWANLTVVETDAGAPNGYSAPGLLFLSPRGIGTQVNSKLLANQISRQWWGTLVSPVNRNHLWLTNGFATYAEGLYLEQTKGPAALEAQMREENVDALTVDNIPMSQCARLEDYSPELNALSGSKGASTLHMLRFVLGDEKFFQVLKEYPKQFAWKSASTADFRKVAETIGGQDLNYFFIQWVESSGAPEFKLEYTIFRTTKGFRAMGKVSQDLDTFRMPVDLKIETEGNPEEKRVEVVGTSSEFSVETFGKPKSIVLDPNNRVLRYNNDVRVAVAIRRGEQFAEISEFGEALKEYQKALETNRNSSLAHYRVAEVYFLQNNYQAAANEFREALNGDQQPRWTVVWSHINLGYIFDITGQRERAMNEYRQAERTKDNTQGALEVAAKHLKEPYERKSGNF